MIRFFGFWSLVWITVSGITLEEINAKPSSRAKNFLIWQYLQQEITPQQAERAFYQLDPINTKHYLIFAKQSKHSDVIETARCLQLPSDQWAEEADDACVSMALSPYKVSKLNLSQRRALASRFKGAYAAPWLHVMAKATPKTLETMDQDVVMQVLTRGGNAYRGTLLKAPMSSKLMQSLAKHPKISRLIILGVPDPNLKGFHRALLEVEGQTLSAQANFFLGLNALRFGATQKASAYLQYAHDHFYFRMDKDKARFWQFLATQDTSILRQLAHSVDINIYSLYAAETFKIPVENYFNTLPTDPKSLSLKMEDPFVWKVLLEEIRRTPKGELFALAHHHNAPGMEPVQAFILERAYGYRMHNYITPYQVFMKGMTRDKQAIMLALMRQESHFIPSALSRSYALGLMQMMPFLVKAMDKDAKRPVGSLSKMFDAQTNIQYASKHIDTLMRSFYHPLFIAYAYNGGPGFTRRHLLGGTFHKGAFEPFWSMEMMQNSESREYGKKVLANYVIYKRLFNEPISIVRLFDNLLYPSRSDRYRASK